MKNHHLLYPALIILALASCNGSGIAGAPTAPFPKPGATVAAASEPVTEDTLNKFIFSVKVIADSNVADGMYDVDADYGPNFAESKMKLPKGGERYTPAIRKGSEPYTYIIGFRIPGDTTFYDYYQVSSSLGATKMRYIKAYTF